MDFLSHLKYFFSRLAITESKVELATCSCSCSSILLQDRKAFCILQM